MHVESCTLFLGCKRGFVQCRWMILSCLCCMSAVCWQCLQTCTAHPGSCLPNLQKFVCPPCVKAYSPLSVAPQCTGEGLCSLLKGEGRADTAQALCREISTRAPGATWAWRRLAFFALDAADFEKAVVCFQTALRGDVKHVGAWEGLGSAYQSLARLTAALKVCPLVSSQLACCISGSEL